MFSTGRQKIEFLELEQVRKKLLWIRYDSTYLDVDILVQLFPAERIGTSRPSQRCRRTMKKEMNSNVNVMKICVAIYMRCSIVILFTCVLVLSCLVGKGGCTCEI
jgi:hypothetical protein